MPSVVLFVLLLPATLVAQNPAAPTLQQARAPESAEPLSLDLRRPWSPGDAFTVTAEVAIHALGGSGQDVEFWTSQSKDTDLAFTGTVRVADVNAAGEPTIALIHVNKARVTEAGAEEAMKVEGADLGLSFPLGQPRFVRRDGQPVLPDEAVLLLTLFRPPTGVNEADYLAPGAPVRVGDSWPVREPALEKALSASAASARAGALEDVKGTVTLEALEDWSGVPCYRLLVRYSFRTGDSERFVGTTLTQVEQRLWVPRDPAIKLSRRSAEATVKVNGRVRNDANQLLEVKGQTKTTRRVEFQPLGGTGGT